MNSNLHSMSKLFHLRLCAELSPMSVCKYNVDMMVHMFPNTTVRVDWSMGNNSRFVVDRLKVHVKLINPELDDDDAGWVFEV